MNEKELITKDTLIDFGFKQSQNGDYWIPNNLATHYLELIESDGFWYPVYVQVPEISSQEEQCVSMHRVKTINELKLLFKVLTGQELKTIKI